MVVLVLLGIVFAVALPKLFDASDFKKRGFFDEVQAAARYGQKLAVSTGCPVRLDIAGASYTLLRPELDCSDSNFISLTAEHPVTSGSMAGVTLTSSHPSVTFDAMGRALVGAVPSDVTVTVGTRSFQIIGETGYIQTP
ncbi:hypothetical protein DESUT3_34670 [Desulfuromonas versatilis]|uniref:Type II secretion system protein H n=1 Tax=Desulfuromonas versatilis TaxID=2802975 RepID=A0ABN6E216_9BACT|nr:hypothetical protein DESUT3_34670 [Desulfuromonas versatilis]